MNELDTEIRELERAVCLDNSVPTKQKLLALRAEYEELSTQNAEDSLLRLKQTFYEQGGKPSRLLAWQIKKLNTERAINAIRNEKGVITTDPLEINQTFVSFYKTLYQSKYPAESIDQNTFLDGLEIPTIPENTKLRLDKELDATDIVTAIGYMKNGKAAGPDGMPIDIYIDI